MIHHHRTFGVGVVGSLDELVEKLTEHTWTLCTCFAYQGLLFANDSFSEDGAQEYAVYKEDRQIESLTVSWMTRESLREVIEGLLRGTYEELEFRPIQPLDLSLNNLQQAAFLDDFIELCCLLEMEVPQSNGNFGHKIIEIWKFVAIDVRCGLESLKSSNGMLGDNSDAADDTIIFLLRQG